MRKNHLTGLAMALAVAACAGEAPGERAWTGTVDTLPDGRVRVVNTPAGVWAAGEPWRLVPDLRLGAIDGPEAEIFASISGLQVDGSGRIYVLDRQTNELRIFGPDGSHARTVGGEGGGPGEYRAANGLEWVAPDSLLVVDQQGSRYSVLTSDGDLVRTVHRPLPFYGWVYSGAYLDGRVYEVYSVGAGGERLPALLGSSLARRGAEAGPRTTPDSAGRDNVGDTILLPVPDVTVVPAFSVRTDRGGMTMSVPFRARAVYHVGPEGTLWHGHGESPRLFRSTLAGDTLLEVHVGWEPTPVTSEEIEEWRTGSSVERFLAMGGDLDVSRIPDVKPLFESIYVDSGGYVWLSVPTGADRTAFAVLDPDGRYLGDLHVDGVDRDTFVAPVVRNGKLHLVGRDELGVQSVYRFRIEGRE